MENLNLKELVARKAAHLVKNGMVVGLGTGSTVFYTIQELGERIKKEGLKFKAIPTSVDSEKKARETG
ncbi:TPA: ribose 5-phosphate isomerase A, partial [archaeon]|nr:ribose 5-phosphate isomerase A [Candidatus Naiadarchaeales archaeon SRR2090153.bin461]